MEALVVLNPSSGQEQADSYEEQLRKVLGNHYEQVVVKRTAAAGDATLFAQQASDAGVSLVVAVGGDGTINEVVNGLAEHDARPRMAIVPLGTVNDLARALEIPLDPTEAIELLDNPQYQMIDVGKANDTYFTNSFSVGNIPRSVQSVSVDEKTLLGPLAYVKEGLKEFVKDETFHVTIDSDAFQWEGEAATVMVGSTNYLAGVTNLLPEAEPNDGLLHGIIVKNLSMKAALAILPHFIKKKIEISDYVIKFTAKKITMTSSTEMPSNIDGDPGENLPAELTLLHNHIEVAVPKQSEE